MDQYLDWFFWGTTSLVYRCTIIRPNFDPVDRHPRCTGEYDLVLLYASNSPWTRLPASSRVLSMSRMMALMANSSAATNRNVARVLSSLQTDHRTMLADWATSTGSNVDFNVDFALSFMEKYMPFFIGNNTNPQTPTYGQDMAEAFILNSILSDGSPSEFSYNYAIGTMLKYLEAYYIRSYDNVQALSAPLRAALSRHARYYALIATPVFSLPRLTYPTDNFLLIRSQLQLLADLFQDPFLLGVATGGTMGTFPPATTVPFMSAGHFVFRTAWNDTRASWLFFEPGPRGAGHSHNAANSVSLFANGEWLIQDPGYYSRSSNRFMNFLPTSRAHATAVVNNAEQIPVKGVPTLSYVFQDNATHVMALGSFANGYVAAPFARHTRQVLLNKLDQSFTFVDTFARNSSVANVTILWPLSYLAQVAVQPDNATIVGETLNTLFYLSVSCSARFTLQVISGQTSPTVLGFYSPVGGTNYGALTASPVAVVNLPSPALPATCTTTLSWTSKVPSTQVLWGAIGAV